jgi:endonuclease III
MKGLTFEYSRLLHEAEQRSLKCTLGEEFQTGIVDAERMLANLEKFSHHFVLACLMDRQFDFRKAWAIPYRVGLHIGGFEFSAYKGLTPGRIQKIFEKERLHRFQNNMAQIFFSGIRRIASNYEDDAKNIWADNPPAARIIRRFLEFDGVGLKIATMATNILSRQFKIPMTDLSAVDISPDVRAMRYFVSKGLLRKGAKKEELIYLAREISPKYPGLLDLIAWEQGRGRS